MKSQFAATTALILIWALQGCAKMHGTGGASANPKVDSVVSDFIESSTGTSDPSATAIAQLEEETDVVLLGDDEDY